MHSILIAALGLLVGSLITAGLTAAIAFPTMKRLNPSLDGYPALPGEHWSIVAGHIAHPVLSFAIWAQAALAVAALGVSLFGAGGRGWLGTAVRTCVVTLVLLAGVQLAQLKGTMDPALSEYWKAAAAGDAAKARHWKNTFDAQHPAATRFMGASLVCAVVGVTLSIAVAGRGPEPKTGTAS